MIPTKKSLSALLTLLLAAQNVSAAVITAVRVNAPISGVSGAIGTRLPNIAPFRNSVSDGVLALQADSLKLNVAPVLQKETLAGAAAAALHLSPAQDFAAIQTQALKLPSLIAPADAKKTEQPASPLEQLNAGADKVSQAARNDASGVQTGSALTEFFQGSKPRSDLGSVVPQETPGRQSSALQPTTQPSDLPKLPSADKPVDQQQPRSSVARTFKVGLIAAVVPLLLTNVAIAVALHLGYQLHPNYATPISEGATLLSTALFGVMAAGVAPIAEEVVFRKGIMGTLQKWLKNVPGGLFWIPAVVSSLIFVAVHETADPLLFATRFVHSMILARVYHKEGLPASMAAHGFFNGLLTLPLLLPLLLGPTVGGIAALIVGPLSAFLALRFYRQLKKQAPERKSGGLVNFEISRKAAFTMAAFLGAAFLGLMANPFWIAGAIGLTIYGFSRK